MRFLDIKTSKLIWNSVVRTATDAKNMTINIKNYYLGVTLDHFEHTKMPINTIFFQHIINQYDLYTNAQKGFVYIEISKAIYDLPQAGILTNNLLQ